MKILLLGGTGAMGQGLVKVLKNTSHTVFITSRKDRQSVSENIKYIMGNAHDMSFVKELLKLHNFDVVVDFMSYKTPEFSERYKEFLALTGQYIHLSSSRVYAESDTAITEDSPRLLDICQDAEFLKTDEYPLTKARQENLLFQSGQTNWTIIRPYITYNTERLQLGVFEKEQWLYRALNGRSILFLKDVAEKTTTLTYGNDVAYGIYKIMGNTQAYGQAIHFVSPYAMKWADILELYRDKIEKITGKRPEVKYIESVAPIIAHLNKYQVQYDRLYNRVFDSSKADNIIGEKIEYTPLNDGVERVLTDFIQQNHSFLNIEWRAQATFDKLCKNWTPLNDIHGMKNKLRYLKYRILK